ncbi:MAG: hypothetical protein E7266_10545 [Lachnospiraceae bacterium]|nr:hypothetical protein [Lachnospiraceae bacterium]
MDLINIKKELNGKEVKITHKTKRFDIKKHPKTYKYVLENDTLTRRCNSCGCVVLKETNVEDYPFQCMSCDVNLYTFETHLGKRHTKKEFDELCNNTLILEID